MQDGRTPLAAAAQEGHMRVVDLLLTAHADLKEKDLVEKTALHYARTAVVAQYLLDKGADPNAFDKHRWSPLHVASSRLRHDVVKRLLAWRCPPAYSADGDGYWPLHSVLFGVWGQGCSQEALKMLQLFVTRGKGWDDMCDKITDQVASWPLGMGNEMSDSKCRQWRVEGPAIRTCVARWSQEQQLGRPLTDIPIEHVRRGVDATKNYISQIAESLSVVHRRKICVVGPSFWRKTSLIKSMTSNQPSLIHPDDRTIGIDLFKMRFKEQFDGVKLSKEHEITFWDFAGQDSYQVTHSLFFSARTMYIVCIDLKSFRAAWMQAQLMADTDSELNKWMNDFIDIRVLRWVRVICARQPDAEFVFVATKKDRVRDDDLEGGDSMLADMQKRISNVGVIIQEMKKAFVRSRGHDQEGDRPRSISFLGDPRLKDMSKTQQVQVIVTSCSNVADVKNFRAKIQEVVEKSNQSYAMPDTYTRVLKALLRMRLAAETLATDKRLEQTYLNVEDLVKVLRNTVTRPRNERRPAQNSRSTIAGNMDPDATSNQESSLPPDDTVSGEEADDHEHFLDRTQCMDILHALRDLGDVLWYEDIDDEMLKNKIIIDPMVMNELVRELFNHSATATVIPHGTLHGLEFWRHLEGTPRMLSMKRVLQHFHLVDPTTKNMRVDSDLIVPAYWKSNTVGFWMFGGGDLRFGRGIHREDVAVRVHWKFMFVNNYPHTLFDHVVVESYRRIYKRDVGPDWIMYTDKDKCACRIVLKRSLSSHHWIIHLEALQGHEASDKQVKRLWACFTSMSKSLEKVIREYPGVVVTRTAREDTDEDVEPTRYNFKTLQGGELSQRSRKWMPPQKTWEAYLGYRST